tara:strand:- start:20073 stop:22073 length:2001 start_codon:yes stop_codon:yes gene_type:complete
MAVDPSRTKRNIDFDTYVAPKEGSRVDWGKQAKVISDAFSNVATDRQRRKDEIDADTKANIDKLNALDQMDNKTLMDMTIDGSNSAANAIYEAEQKMKRGELRPQDFQKLKQNISSGFTQFQKNAKSWDSDFQRYTERMESGESSSLEQYLGERMESFGNLKNLQLVTNPDTGNLAFGRIDEDGNLLTGPDDLISINRMTAISKQEINKVNVGEFVKSSAEELGTYILAGNATTMGKDGSSRAVFTIEDFMQTEDADEYITDKANEILNSQGSFSVGSILADSGVKNKYKEAFRGGDQEEFDKWLKDNPNAEPSENPIIVMGYKENGVVVEPAITEGQETIARDYIKRSIRGALDRKETMKESSYQPATANIARGDKRNEEFSYVDQAQKIVTGNQQDFQVGVTTLAESYNNSPKGRNNPLAENPVDRNSDENFILITYASGEVKKIPRFELDSNGDAVIDKQGNKKIRDYQQQNAEILSYMSPVSGSTDQIYKEYNRNNPGGLKDYGGSGKKVKYLGVGDKVIEDSDLSKELVMVDGSPVGVGDRFLEISQQDVDDEEQLAQYSTVVNSVLGSQVGELTKNFQVESEDLFTGTGNRNKIKVTIEETPYTIEFDTKKDSAKLQSELQRIINSYKEKVRKERTKKETTTKEEEKETTTKEEEKKDMG